MHGRIAAELLGKMIPLATGPGAVDNPVQATPLVGAGTPHLGRWVQFGKKRSEEVLPHLVRNRPDGRQPFALVRFTRVRFTHANSIGNLTLLG